MSASPEEFSGPQAEYAATFRAIQECMAANASRIADTSYVGLRTLAGSLSSGRYKGIGPDEVLKLVIYEENRESGKKEYTLGLHWEDEDGKPHILEEFEYPEDFINDGDSMWVYDEGPMVRGFLKIADFDILESWYAVPVDMSSFAGALALGEEAEARATKILWSS